MRTALFQDHATAGEGAGYSMGLIMLGTASEKAIDEMMAYARETQHEKIIRSLSVGMAFIMYGQRERADSFIEKMAEDKVSQRLEDGHQPSVLLVAVSRLTPLGRHSAIRRHVHDRSGVRRYW